MLLLYADEVLSVSQLLIKEEATKAMVKMTCPKSKSRDLHVENLTGFIEVNKIKIK